MRRYDVLFFKKMTHPCFFLWIMSELLRKNDGDDYRVWANKKTGALVFIISIKTPTIKKFPTIFGCDDVTIAYKTITTRCDDDDDDDDRHCRASFETQKEMTCLKFLDKFDIYLD